MCPSIYTNELQSHGIYCDSPDHNIDGRTPQGGAGNENLEPPQGGTDGIDDATNFMKFNEDTRVFAYIIYIYIYIYVHIHTYLHIYIYMHIQYTYIYIYMCVMTCGAYHMFLRWNIVTLDLESECCIDLAIWTPIHNDLLTWREGRVSSHRYKFVKTWVLPCYTAKFKMDQRSKCTWKNDDQSVYSWCSILA